MTHAGKGPVPPPGIVTISPGRGWKLFSPGELWSYRELLYFLVWRDVKVRYKQTALGAAWAVLQPLLAMAVFTIFFGRMASVGSDGLPYPLFSFAGLLPWTFFAQGLSQCSNSLVGSANLVTKVYFPRLIIPAASVLSGAVDFGIALVFLAGMMALYGIVPAATVVFLPLLLLLAFGSALGAGLWLSALNVEYRDVRYVAPFFVNLWLFLTPVIYPGGTVYAKLAELGLPPWVAGINPMTGVVVGFRWALFGTGAGTGAVLSASACVTVLLLVGGAFYFRRMERTFADVV